MNPILYWNLVALDLVALNHPDFFNANLKPNQLRSETPDQPGPTRTSRAYAIAHLAMNDAWLGASGSAGMPYLPSKGVQVALPSTAQISAVTGNFAIAAAAAYTLGALYPKQADKVAEALRIFHDQQGNVPAGQSAAGTLYGQSVARAMLALRATDKSSLDGGYVPLNGPENHRPDPVNPDQGFLDPRWGEVDPFFVPGMTGDFVAPPPPAADSARFKQDFAEVKSYGDLNSTTRTNDQRRIALVWAYDGARAIGVPPRLYNQVVRAVAVQQGVNDTTRLAALFAAVNGAMADAGISAWFSKYKWHIGRPVVVIREADVGYGPTGQGLGTGGAGYSGDFAWQPLGAPRTNEPAKPSLSPNFPAYPSGHATFGTACLQVVRRFFGTAPETRYDDLSATEPDNLSFEFVSDEMNGKSVDADGTARPLYTNRYQSAEQAIVENAESRIWLGVHWRFDADGGVTSGRAIGDHVATAFFGQTSLPPALAKKKRK